MPGETKHLSRKVACEYALALSHDWTNEPDFADD